MDNAKLISEECGQHRNELVLDPPWDVVRLLGWTDQYDEDYYYMVLNLDGVWCRSCVMGFVWLKDYLPKEEYDQLDKIFEMNLDLNSALKETKERGIILK